VTGLVAARTAAGRARKRRRPSGAGRRRCAMACSPSDY